MRECPVCKTGSIAAYSEQSWAINALTFRLAQCLGCGSAFTDPLPSDEILKTLYSTSFDYRWYRDHYQAKLRDCRQRIAEYAPRLGRRVLDFGGGLGYFSQVARENGFDSITYDPYTLNSEQPSGVWDSIVALHVLEHSNNLDRTVRQIKSMLVPGGRLILAVPNFSSAGYKQLGMGWVWAQPPLLHVFHFTACGVEAVLKRHGFENIVVSCHERWDANLYSDLEEVARFRKMDADWPRFTHRGFGLVRRFIAWRNSRARFAALAHAIEKYDPTDDIYAELEVTATLAVNSGFNDTSERQDL